MSDSVETANLFEDATAFLADLSANNSRDWFHANKLRYDSLLKRPAEKLASDMAHWFEDSQGVGVKPKLFRPHRDVRFSKDKTPYHTHLHLMWSLPDGRSWMFGLSPTYATAGAGVMGFEKGQIDHYRAAVDGDAGQELTELLAVGNWRLDEPELKRVPAPYPSTHNRGDLLRRKGLVVWRDNLDKALHNNPQQALQAAFAELTPVLDWLGRALT